MSGILRYRGPHGGVSEVRVTAAERHRQEKVSSHKARVRRAAEIKTGRAMLLGGLLVGSGLHSMTTAMAQAQPSSSSSTGAALPAPDSSTSPALPAPRAQFNETASQTASRATQAFSEALSGVQARQTNATNLLRPRIAAARELARAADTAQLGVLGLLARVRESKGSVESGVSAAAAAAAQAAGNEVATNMTQAEAGLRSLGVSVGDRSTGALAKAAKNMDAAASSCASLLASTHPLCRSVALSRSALSDKAKRTGEELQGQADRITEIGRNASNAAIRAINGTGIAVAQDAGEAVGAVEQRLPTLPPASDRQVIQALDNQDSHAVLLGTQVAIQADHVSLEAESVREAVDRARTDARRLIDQRNADAASILGRQEARKASNAVISTQTTWYSSYLPQITGACLSGLLAIYTWWLSNQTVREGGEAMKGDVSALEIFEQTPPVLFRDFGPNSIVAAVEDQLRAMDLNPEEHRQENGKGYIPDFRAKKLLMAADLADLAKAYGVKIVIATQEVDSDGKQTVLEKQTFGDGAPKVEIAALKIKDKDFIAYRATTLRALAQAPVEQKEEKKVGGN